MMQFLVIFDMYMILLAYADITASVTYIIQYYIQQPELELSMR